MLDMEIHAGMFLAFIEFKMTSLLKDLTFSFRLLFFTKSLSHYSIKNCAQI